MQTRSLALLALLLFVAVAARGNVQVVAVGGDAAPDGNGKFFDFDIPSMNGMGEVVVVTTLGDTTGGNNDNTAILRGTGVPGSLSLIVRRGDPSPDRNGNFSLLDPDSVPVINDAGQVAFIAGLSGTFGGASDNTGMFRSEGTSGGLTQIVRQGQPLPGTRTLPSFRGGGVSHPFSFNEMGQVAFDVIGFGIFRSSGGSLTQIARSSQSLPGGGTFIAASIPPLNDSGQVAVADFISGIFRGDGSTILPIAHAGDPAPDGNGTFAAPFSNVAINNRGDVTFFANLTGTSGSATDNQGLFIGTGDALTTIVRRGQAAPDGNGRFLDLNADVAINEAGQMAFLATLTATSGGASDNSALFRGDGSTLKQIVRLGDQAPDGSRINSLGKPALNDVGQVAFLGGLIAASGLSTSQGIFLYDDNLGLLQAVRTGDALLGSRIGINSTLIFEPSVTYNGKKRSSLNERGEIVFRFDLDDGRRGIAVANPFVASATPTPTPSPTPTSTDTPQPTPTAAAAACVGDCDGGGDVTVNELIVLVNIALGSAQPSACPHGVSSRSAVDIALIVQAVNNALNGCAVHSK
jgi:hypothetical protein